MFEVFVWGGLACGVWLATLPAVTVPELCFAVAAAIPAGYAGRATRRILGGDWHVRARWLWLPVSIVATAVAELPATFRVALRGGRGRIAHDSLEPVPESRAPARAAAYVLATSATPGSLVIHDDQAHRRFTIHTLATAPAPADSLIEKVVSR